MATPDRTDPAAARDPSPVRSAVLRRRRRLGAAVALALAVALLAVLRLGAGGDPRPSPAAEDGRWHGLVRLGTPLGPPLGGVGVGTLLDREPTATTDPAGRFALPASDARYVLAIDERYATLAAGLPPAPEVIVGTRVRIAGRVEDPWGEPIAASVAAAVRPGGAWPSPDAAAWTPWTHEARKLGGGRFELDAPWTRDAVLEVAAGGWRTHREPLPASDVEDLVVVLERAPPREPAFDGIVLHADGEPAAGAFVRIDCAEPRRTGPDGRFRLEVVRDPGPGRRAAPVLVASWLPGVQAATAEALALFGPATDGPPRVPDAPVELRLGPPALAFTGRLVRDDGTPAAGWGVELADPLDPRCGVPLEALVGAWPAAGLVTDADGRFAVDGLFDRPVHLRFVEPGRRDRFFAVGPFRPPAEDVRVTVPLALARRLTGRVVAPDGAGVVGVEVRAFLPASVVVVARAASDELGYFELVDVPRHPLVLSVEGGVVRARYALELDPAEPLWLAVERLVPLEVVVREPGWTHLSAVDAAGERRDLFRPDGSWHPTQRLVGGHWAGRVPETVVALVLTDGEGTRRVPVALEVGRTNALEVE